MQIDYIVCPETIEEKLAKKHRVAVREARQALLNNPRIRFAEKGYTEGEDVMPLLARPLADDTL